MTQPAGSPTSSQCKPTAWTRGVATVELAILLPAFLLVTLGGIEIGHLLYVKTVLRGEIERAGRSSSLETGITNISTIDTKVTNIVQRVAPGANVTFDRRSYRSYANVKNRAEPFQDGNGDGICNNGEAYQDMNNNGHWDADAGLAGLGSARQIVAYDINVKFQPLFPFMEKALSKSAFEMKTSTQLRNQPYSAASIVETRACS